jgi:spermidine synthase
LLAHGQARRVLVIGGGDGGVLRRVLEHRTVERAIMVEIDGEVIRLAREHLPSIGGSAWSDPRAEVIVGDGLAFLANSPDADFDVVIVDSTDPVGVGETLFTDQFYRDCSRALGPGGLVVNQSGVPFLQASELVQTSRRRANAFPYVSAYVAAVPTYVGGFMALGIAAKQPHLDRLPAELITARAEAAGILGRTKYWSPEVHTAAFCLPPYIAQLLP